MREGGAGSPETNQEVAAASPRGSGEREGVNPSLPYAPAPSGIQATVGAEPRPSLRPAGTRHKDGPRSESRKAARRRAGCRSSPGRRDICSTTRKGVPSPGALGGPPLPLTSEQCVAETATMVYYPPRRQPHAGDTRPFGGGMPRLLKAGVGRPGFCHLPTGRGDAGTCTRILQAVSAVPANPRTPRRPPAPCAVAQAR